MLWLGKKDFAIRKLRKNVQKAALTGSTTTYPWPPHRSDLKELKVRPSTGEHDYQVRLRSAIKFLSKVPPSPPPTSRACTTCRATSR